MSSNEFLIEQNFINKILTLSKSSKQLIRSNTSKTATENANVNELQKR